MQRVAIVHPWLPQYRLPFFEQLHTRCQDSDIAIDSFCGAAPKEWAMRGDTVPSSVVTELKTIRLPLSGKDLYVKRLPRSFRSGSHYDLVIVEQAIRNLETYRLLAGRHRGNIAFWGHGRTYSKQLTRIEETFKAWLTRQGCWFFAYTNGGARAVIKERFPEDRITVVNNSIDTTTLSAHFNAITEKDLSDFRDTHLLTNKTILYLGGLDRVKRVDVLLEVLDLCHREDDEVRALIVGNGSRSDEVSRFTSSRPWATYLGSLFGEHKALAMAAANVLFIPGGVGLVAVDSFAAGVPIVTPSGVLHGPELEYLDNSYNALICENTATGMATALLRVVNTPELQDHLRRGCMASRHRYSMEKMVENFHEGILECLQLLK